MAITRRGFLGALGAAGTMATSVAVPANAEADEFQYRGWTVRWSGWREPINQMLVFGYWSADRAERDEIIAATTTGTVRAYHPCHVMDLSLEPGWAPLKAWDKPETRDALRARARRLLLADLDRRR
jgi:hypothetical protein